MSDAVETPPFRDPPEVDAEGNVLLPVAKPWLDIGKDASLDDVLIGSGRWVTRGSGVFLVAPTGAGKSTWVATQCFAWGIGRASLGMSPTRPLRSLVFQSEDDAGDLEAMKEGAVFALNPTPEETELLRRNVIIATEKARTGVLFLSQIVRPMLMDTKADLLWLNPLSAYFGADLNDQREVAMYFRNILNPILAEASAAAFTVHHCPKPTAERRTWTGSEMAYLLAGNNDLANWSRETIALRETSSGLYEMTCTKRWRKLGWTDAEGRPTGTRLIAHGPDGLMVWRDASAQVLEEMGAKPYSDAALVGMVPTAGIDQAELVRQASEVFRVSERTSVKYVKDGCRRRLRPFKGKPTQCALFKSQPRPRREVYPESPQGRAVIWLTPTADAEELLKR